MRQRFVTLRQRQRHHHYAIFKTFQVAFTVKGFQGVTGVVLPCAKEGLETKTAGVRAFKKLHNEGALIAGQDACVVVALFDQIVEALILARKDHAVGSHMGGKKGVHRLAIFPELNSPLTIVEVKHCV